LQVADNFKDKLDQAMISLDVVVGSRTLHRMFVVDLERAAASSWYGQDHDRRCTGQNEERGPSLLGGDRAGSSWWL
jgi:hypothetical protein